MGGPKALLRWTDDQPLAVAHAEIGAAVCARVVVVARASVALILRPQLPIGILVTSTAPGSLGPAGSIAAAVRAGVLESMRWVLLAPVDGIPAAPKTILALCHAAASCAQSVHAVRPCFEGRRGHPVLVRSDVVADAYLVHRPLPLRDVLRGLACVEVSVDDPSVAADLNTPEAYRARVGTAPCFDVGWRDRMASKPCPIW